MKRIATVSVFCLILCAFVALPVATSMQQRGGRGAGGRGGRGAAPPQNVQVLPAGTDVRMVMQGVAAALGVECTYCHVQGDFPSDEMATKQTARQMMRMVQAINNDFLADLPTHEGGEAAAAVTCNTCHRGSTHPEEN